MVLEPFDRNEWVAGASAQVDSGLEPFDRDAWVRSRDETFGVQEPTTKAPEQAAPIEQQPPVQAQTPEDARLEKVSAQAQEASALQDQDSFLKDTWSSLQRGRSRQKLYELLADAGESGNEDFANQVQQQIKQYESSVGKNEIEANNKLGTWWYQAMQSVGGGMAESMVKTLAVDAAVTTGAAGMAILAGLVTGGPDPTDAVTVPAAWAATAKAIRAIPGISRVLTAAGRAKRAGALLRLTDTLVDSGMAAEKATRFVRLAANARTVGDIAKFGVVTSLWARQGKGEIMTELMDRNIDPSIREPASTIGGFLYGAIENIGIIDRPLDVASSVAGNQLKKLVADGIVKSVGSAVSRYGIEVVKESFEEFLQEGVVTTTTNLAVRQQIEKAIIGEIDAAVDDPKFQMISGAEQFRRSWNAFKSSLGPMLILGGIGGAPGIAGAALRNRRRDGTPDEAPPQVEQTDPETFEATVANNAQAIFDDNETEERIANRETIFKEELRRADLREGVTSPFGDTSAPVENLDEASTFDDNTGATRPLTDGEKYTWNLVRALEFETSGREAIFVDNLGENARWTDKATFYDLTNPDVAALGLFLHEGLSHEMYRRSGTGPGMWQSSGDPDLVARGQEVRATLDSVFDFIAGGAESNASFKREMNRLRRESLSESIDPQGDTNEEFRARVLETFMTDESFFQELLNDNPGLFQRLWTAVQEFFKTMRGFLVAERTRDTKATVNDSGIYSDEQLSRFFGDQILDARNTMLTAAKSFVGANKGSRESINIAQEVIPPQQVRAQAAEQQGLEAPPLASFKQGQFSIDSKLKKDKRHAGIIAKLEKGEELTADEAVTAQVFEALELIERTGEVVKEPAKAEKPAKKAKPPKPEERKLFVVPKTSKQKARAILRKPSQAARFREKLEEAKIEKVKLFNLDTGETKTFSIVANAETEKLRIAFENNRQIQLPKTRFVVESDKPKTFEGESFMVFTATTGGVSQVKVKDAREGRRGTIVATPLESGRGGITAGEEFTFSPRWVRQEASVPTPIVATETKSWSEDYMSEFVDKASREWARIGGVDTTPDNLVAAAESRVRDLWGQTLLERISSTRAAELKKKYFNNRALYTKDEIKLRPDGTVRVLESDVGEAELIRRARLIDRGLLQAARGAIRNAAKREKIVPLPREELVAAESGKVVTQIGAEEPAPTGARKFATVLEQGIYDKWKSDFDAGERPSRQEFVEAHDNEELGDVSLIDAASALQKVINATKQATPPLASKKQAQLKKVVDPIVRQAQRALLDNTTRPDALVASEVAARVEQNKADPDEMVRDFSLVARKRRTMNQDAIIPYGQTIQEALNQRGNAGDDQKRTSVISILNKIKSDTGRSLRQAGGTRARGEEVLIRYLASFSPLRRFKAQELNAADKRREGVVLYDEVIKMIDHYTSKKHGADSMASDTTIQRRAAQERDEMVAKLFQDLPDPRTIDVTDPKIAGQYVRAVDAMTSDRWDRAIEWWKTSVLSGVATIIQNPISNFANLTYELGPKRVISNQIQRVLGGNVTEGETRALWRGLFRSQGDAFRTAANAWQSGLPALTRGGHGQKHDPGSTQFAIPDKFGGQFIRWPFRALTSADEYFKHAILQAEITGSVFNRMRTEAKASKGKLNMEDVHKEVQRVMIEQDSDEFQNALSRALDFTWQKEPNAFAKGVLAFKRRVGPAGEFIFPFVTTPMNILTTGLRKSPLGALSLAIKSARAAAKRGGYWDTAAQQFDKREFADNVAEQVLAWGALAMVASLMGDPDDPDEGFQMSGALPVFATVPAGKGRFERTERIPPMSIKIGKKVFDYSRIEPFATIFPPIVDALRVAFDKKKGKPSIESLNEAFGRTAMALSDKTFMGYLQDMGEAAQNPAKAQRFAGNFAASWIPNLFRSTARALDPYERDLTITGAKNSKEYFTGATKVGLHSAFPLPIKDLAPAPRVDYWGNTIRRAGDASPSTDLLYRLFSLTGIKSKEQKENALSTMIMNWNNTERYAPKNFKKNIISKTQEPGDAFYPQKPSRFISHKKEQLWLTDQQYQKYVKIIGEAASSIARKIKFNTDQPTKRDVAILRNVRERARAIAKARILKDIIVAR